MHLVSRGFMDGYTRWTRHGEEEVMDEDTQGSEMPNLDQCHMDVVLEICPRGNNKMVIIIFPCS